MKDTISVIVPVYNVEPYLRQCLDSIVDQTYRDLEIILVDDGSPDNCGAICDEYAAKDDRITVVHKANGGLSAAWNDGIHRASGEWVAFVDSDDWLDTDYFEKIMANAEALGASNADVIISGGRIDEKEEPGVTRNFTAAKYFISGEEREYLKTRVNCNERTSSGEILSGLGLPWDKVFRLEFIKTHNLWYDESLRGCADMLFDYQAFDLARKVIGCTYYGYHYRYITSGISKKLTPYRPVMFHDYLEKLHSYIYSHGEISPKISDSLNAAAIGFIASSLKLYYFNQMNEDSYQEVARKIKEMKKWKWYNAAIHAKDNQYINAKMKVLKAALRVRTEAGSRRM